MISPKQKELVDLACQIIANPTIFTVEQKVDVIDSLEKLSSKSSSWWVVLLKVLAYAIGLILGGAVTTSCIHLIG